MKIKVTMADGKVIVGERHWFDTFLDGWSTTRLHNYEIREKNETGVSIVIAQGRTAKIRNNWFVIEEDD